MIDSPIQAAVSNDCAFFAIGAFLHWTLRGTRDVPKSFRFSTFGKELREQAGVHVHHRQERRPECAHSESYGAWLYVINLK